MSVSSRLVGPPRRHKPSGLVSVPDTDPQHLASLDFASVDVDPFEMEDAEKSMWDEIPVVGTPQFSSSSWPELRVVEERGLLDSRFRISYHPQGHH